MKNKEVAILEIGSSQIRIFIGKQGVNNTYNIVSSSFVDYSGYSDGEFVDVFETKNAISLAKKQCEDSCGLIIKNIYVGVPAQFCALTLKNVNVSSQKKMKISKEIVDQMLEKGKDERYNDDYIVISNSASYYCLDDNRRMIDPIGQKSAKISALISCVYAEKNKVQFLNNILQDCGIEFVEYLSETKCEAEYLVKDNDKDTFALIVDCGYSTTSVALVRGNALLMLQSFSYGGAHIEADIADYFKIPFRYAGELKNKAILSVVADKKDFYELNINDRMVKFSMEEVNNVIASRVEFIGSAVRECIKMCKEDYPEFMNIGLTGGGISYLKGGKDCLAKTIGKNVDLLMPDDPAHGKPSLSACLGLLSVAIKNSQKSV